MKIQGIRPGQLFAVHFPYAPEVPTRGFSYTRYDKMGFRVTTLDPNRSQEGIEVTVENVKNGAIHRYFFVYHEDVPSNWVLLEGVR